MDTSMLDTLARIAPDLMEEMELRALVLERVAALSPIGRRALAARLHLAERDVRSAADALKRAGCIVQSASGMEVTAQGQNLVDAARRISRGRRSLSSMELTLSRRLNAERVCVVPGDADRDESVIAEIGRAAAREIRFLLQDAHVLAVSGGRAVEAAAQAICVAAPMEITVVPANGAGSCGALRLQANTLAEEIGMRLGGSSRALHLPDGLSAAAAAELAALPQVREALELLKNADALLYGVRSAEEAAQSRGLSPSDTQALLRQGAVGEALGFYFDAGGCVVGGCSPALEADCLGQNNHAALLAGGKGRAQAVLGVCRHHAHRLLVIDEGMAQQIVDLLRV